MNNTYIYSGNPKSKSAKALANRLGIKRIKHENSRFKGREDKTVINWGCADNLPLNCYKGIIINHNALVNYNSSKLNFFLDMEEYTPPFTLCKEGAKEMVQNGAVVCRTILNGHGGAGIIVATNEDELVRAPLYVQYIKKYAEYRVHCMDGEVIDMQRKIKDPDRDVTDWLVRSHDNGFIYARNGLDHDSLYVIESKKAALECFIESGLDFGAVDVIYNAYHKKAYVLEINTAPGLEGQTLESYANGFEKLIAK